MSNKIINVKFIKNYNKIRETFMIKKLFQDKRFIFIFTFVMEMVFFYFFEYLPYGGEYFLPDMGFPIVFGLMFGPAGALGQATAILIGELISGWGFNTALIEFIIAFLVGCFSYKIWYSLFTKYGIDTPKINSTHNILKFMYVVLLSTIFYFIMLNLCFNIFPEIMAKAYPLKDGINVISYPLNAYIFSLLFGLLFITLFNINKIPLQYPKNSFYLINVNYKYFSIYFIALIIYLLLNRTVLSTPSVINNIIFVFTLFIIALFYVNKLDVHIEEQNQNFSIIEKLILIFMIILAAVIQVLFSDFKMIIDPFIESLNSDYITLIYFIYASALIIILCAIHIYYLERTISNPIYDLIESLKEYKINHKVTGDYTKLEKHLNRNDDISRLIESFILLNKNTNNYLTELKETTAEKEKIETEFAVANNIQMGMLKTDFKEFSKNKTFEIYGFMNPAREVGGDFYDYYQLDEDNIGFVIGDVSGKGVPATLIMVKTMYLIKNHSEFNDNPEELYEDVNNLLSSRNDEELFVTSWYGKLNLKTGKLKFVNAGHNQPLICKNNEFDYLDIKSNFVLGVIEDFPYEEEEITLNPGDIVFLYTDGITEANHDYKGFYGEDRLKEILNKHKDDSLDKIIETVKNDIYQFCQSEEQFDDMTMLAIKFNGCESDE